MVSVLLYIGIMTSVIKNILIYLSSFEGGNTNVYSAETRATHEPKEDDVIVFGGLHSMEQPKVGRRIVLVATYL